MTTWSEIEVGDVIQGKDGKAWEITAKLNHTFTLARNGAAPYRGTPHGEVTRLLSKRAVMERAVAVTQVRLGGVVAAVKDEDGIYQTPVDFSEPGALHAHVYILHGGELHGPADYLPDLLSEHANLHKPAEKAKGWVPHHHNPDFLKVIQQ